MRPARDGGAAAAQPSGPVAAPETPVGITAMSCLGAAATPGPAGDYPRGCTSSPEPYETEATTAPPFDGVKLLRSVLAKPHVLEFLVRVMIWRRHVVLHLRQVHHAPRPPDARDVVHVPEHDLLDLVDERSEERRVGKECRS